MLPSYKTKIDNNKLNIKNLSINLKSSENLENFVFTTTPRVPRPVGRPMKRRKTDEENPPVPITFATIFKRKYKRLKRKLSKTDKYSKPIKVLVDSGASLSIIHKRCILDNKIRKGNEMVWQTTAGEIATDSRCKL